MKTTTSHNNHARTFTARLASFRLERAWKSLLAVGLLGLGMAGCDNGPAAAVCEYQDTCNALSGISVQECTENLMQSSMTDSQMDDCANCIDGKSCSTVANGDCDAACTATFQASVTPAKINESNPGNEPDPGDINTNSSGSGPEGPSSGG